MQQTGPAKSYLLASINTSRSKVTIMQISVAKVNHFEACITLAAAMHCMIIRSCTILGLRWCLELGLQGMLHHISQAQIPVPESYGFLCACKSCEDLHVRNKKFDE